MIKSMNSKIRLFHALVIFLVSFLNNSHSVANERPTIETFSASTTEIDLSNPNLSINFELKVAHENGISDNSVVLSLTNSLGSSVSISLNRLADSNLENQKTATFKGVMNFPRNFPPGLYTYLINDGVSSNLKNGFKISTQRISNPIIRSIKGLESGIIVRKNGYVDLNYSTFNGPAFGLQIGKSYFDSSKYLSLPTLLWKVGESLPVKNYYEITGTQVNLEISTLTPKICTFSNSLLNLISEGSCQIVASTPRTENYLAKEVITTMPVGPSRLKQVLKVDSIAAQSAKNLPVSLELPLVRGLGYSLYNYVYPKTLTPNVCVTAGYTVKFTAGGLCMLTYQAEGDSEYLPSDVYTQSILVERINQTISFNLPTEIDLSLKTINLTAITINNNPITYSTNSVSICSINGTTLNLLRTGNCTVMATQAGTPIFLPETTTATLVITAVSLPTSKTITCIKGNKIKKIYGTNPKCSKGYKLKK